MKILTNQINPDIEKYKNLQFIDDKKWITDKMLLRTIVEYNNLNGILDNDSIINIFREFFYRLFENNIQLEDFYPRNHKNCETYIYSIPTVVVPTVDCYKEVTKVTLSKFSDILKKENISKIIIDKVKLSFNSEKIVFEIIGIKEL